MAEVQASSPAPLANSRASQPAETNDLKAARAKQFSGEAFLRAADKINTTISSRISFLRSKGFTSEEIFKCFQAVGQPQTLELINSVANGHAAVSEVSHRPALPPFPQVSPYFSPLPPPKEPYGWKDCFIGATLVGSVLFGAFKVMSSMPWEIVFRKKEDPQIRERKKKEKSERRSVKPLTSFDESSEHQRPVAPAPAAMTLLNEATKEKDDEIQRLKSDLTEKSEQCGKVMKEKAEMSIRVAQLKAQQGQSSRSLENAMKRISELEKTLEGMKGVNEGGADAAVSVEIPDAHSQNDAGLVAEQSEVPASES